MVELINHGVYLLNGNEIRDNYQGMTPDEARENTITYGILRSHDVDGGKGNKMRIRFDAMMSHDITYVGIIQTARASGLEEFPLPYAMTNCHNSLCAVGGTINEDDHVFGLSAAKKYGGIYVPANQAVIHQFAREMLAKCGDMILGSDSHTRYGALGTMAIGEGGGELAKQLLGKTYDVNMPGVIAVYLTGSPVPGVGPQDVALAIIKAVFANGYVKNKVMEFVGPGVANLSADFRIGIDVMTTETTCLSSIWSTDEKIREFYSIHGREGDYKELNPGEDAYYDGALAQYLTHPSNEIPKSYLVKVEGDIPQADLAKLRKGVTLDDGQTTARAKVKLKGIEGNIYSYDVTIFEGKICDGKVCLFSGESGVGKSSLIKALDPTLDPKIGKISVAHLQGKHTTSLYEMYELASGGAVIDTPGLRGFGLVNLEKEEIARYFPEMLRAAEGCRFTPCTHTHEPGCAVKEAVENGEISAERYSSYLGMIEEDKKFR